MHMDKDLKIDGVTKGFLAATGILFFAGSLLNIYTLWYSYKVTANCLSGSGVGVECGADSSRLFAFVAKGLICLSLVLGLIGAVRILALRAKVTGRKVYDIWS